MKTRIAAALASLIFASSMGAAAYAHTTPQQMTPQPASTSAQSNQMSGQNSSSGMTSSSNIEEKVKHALTAHGVTATNVQVSFSNGTATLTGTVYNHRDINKAKKAAMHVRGVKHVDVSGLQAKSARSSAAPASS